MLDPFGRAVSYLRVSVTDRCNYRCNYCMAEDMVFLPRRELLTLEELERKLLAALEATGTATDFDAAITASGRTLQNSASFSRSFSGIGPSERQTSTWRPWLPTMPGAGNWE